MPPIRNSCVARGVLAANTSIAVYTVPANYVLLLKDIRTSFGAIASVNWEADLIDGSNNQTHSFVYQRVPTTPVDGWVGWVAVNAGDSIQLSVVGTVMAYWISGALLPHVPGF